MGLVSSTFEKNKMIGHLTTNQIDFVLHNEVVGRIGCYSEGQVYIVPISYVFDGKNIFGHTYEGLKIKTMRENPKVCFQVDNFRDMANWKSVIAWGEFIEVSDTVEKNRALKLLFNRHLPVVSSITTHLGNTWPFYSEEPEDIDGIIFKIVLDKRTGKFEESFEDDGVDSFCIM
jgi:nitroimidazol reductase NimA-like FMN-containing flavoprotein (pyridoxamine 5'-phosphate oxidase superfamily)